jgi:hypothetical protein
MNSFSKNHVNSDRIKKSDKLYSSKRQIVLLCLRFGIAIILIIFILQWVDLNVAIETIAKSDVRYVSLIITLAFLDRYIMAYKWAMLLRMRGVGISNAEAFKIYMASGFVGTFLPLGVGADAFKLVRTTITGTRLDKVAASIIMERAIGLLAVTILSVIGLSILVIIHEEQFLVLYYISCIVLVGLSIVLFLSLKVETYRWLYRILSRIEKYRVIRAILDSHRAYIDLGYHKKALGWFFVLSLVEHSILSLMNFWGAQSLGLPIAMIYFFAIIPLAHLLEAVPISINAIGVQEGLYIMLFSLAGLSTTQSLSFAFFMRATGLIMLIPGGIILLQDSMRVVRLRKVGE